MIEKYELSNSFYLECECGLPEHLVKASYFSDDPCDLYIYYHLIPDNIIRRIWNALRYIAGYRSRYGEFGEIVLGPKQVREFITFLNTFILEVSSATNKAV